MDGKGCWVATHEGFGTLIGMTQSQCRRMFDWVCFLGLTTEIQEYAAGYEMFVENLK